MKESETDDGSDGGDGDDIVYGFFQRPMELIILGSNCCSLSW
jgi:hypothetical protein